MSHITAVKTSITDVNMLNAAAKSLGLHLSESNIVRGYKGQKTTADVVWRVNDRYDVGAIKQPDGTYTLVADWWGTGYDLEKKLLDEYQIQKIVRRAKIMGDQIKSKTTLPDGTVEMRILVSR